MNTIQTAAEPTADHTQIAPDPAAPKPLSLLLKETTHSDHQALDQRIMAAKPFAHPVNYAGFLRVQYCFHWATAGLYRLPEVKRWIPEIESGCRLAQVEQDCRDLKLGDARRQALVKTIAPVDADPATALGWLYALEGSNLGGAFLFKFAGKLGFSETYGASHLAGASEGRGRRWRHFKTHLDAIALSGEEIRRACDGGRAAFEFVYAQVERFLF